MYIFLFAFLLFYSQAYAGLIETPVASLPTTTDTGAARIVIDGVNSADCSNGGGNISVLCVYNGAVWAHPGSGVGGGGGIEIGTEVPATCTPETGPNAVFFETDTQIVHVCTATDTFTPHKDDDIQTIQEVFDNGREISTANSEGNAFIWGDGTRKNKSWCDLTEGCIEKPEPLGNTNWQVWPNFEGCVKDRENNSDFLCIDPDFYATGSGVLALSTNEQIRASNYGIEFVESDTNPPCAAGNYNIYADLSETIFKKCVNGVSSALDTVSSPTTGAVRKTADESVTSSTTMQDDDELFFAIDANSFYSFHGIISYVAGQTGDFKFQFTVPVDATGRRHSLHAQSTATSCSSTEQNTWGGPITTAITSVGGTGAQCEAIVDGFVSTGATSGNLRLQFAQDVSDATASTVKIGSFLEWRKH